MDGQDLGLKGGGEGALEDRNHGENTPSFYKTTIQPNRDIHYLINKTGLTVI